MTWRKILFYAALIILAGFEFARIYLVMPLPGSQEMQTLPLAYGLHEFRWMIRFLLVIGAAVGFMPAFLACRMCCLVTLLLVATGMYYIQNNMSADKIFLQPDSLIFKTAEENKIPLDRLVIGVELEGKSKAYPVSLMGYHHQVFDELGGRPFLVTYCTVCRTGRVFDPVNEGRLLRFRLVGMDLYNALFEDDNTGSWWRQATGEAVAGPMKGKFLEEIPSRQGTLEAWLKLHPESLVMQEDPLYSHRYDSLANYENGRSKGRLTRSDTASWQDKSWVVGIQLNGRSKAFDWQRLVQKSILCSRVGTTPVCIVLGSDRKSFYAFQMDSDSSKLEIRKDTLWSNGNAYSIDGKHLIHPDALPPLRAIQAYQEFWHSWRTFHPDTERDAND